MSTKLDVNRASRNGTTEPRSALGPDTARIYDEHIDKTLVHKMRPDVQIVPLNQITTDRSYAREISQKWVDHLVQHFDPRKVGMLDLSRRAHGKYASLDGGHRREALKKLGFTEWPCLVYGVEVPLKMEEEADIYAGLNHDRPQTVRDKWRARLKAKEPVAVAVAEIAKKYGLSLGTEGQNSDGWIQPLSRVEYIYNGPDGPRLLDQTFDLLTGCFGKNIKAYQQSTIAGAAAFLARYRNSAVLDRPKLIHVLQQRGINGLLSDAIDIARAPDEDKSEAGTYFGKALLLTYNRATRNDAKRLPRWIQKKYLAPQAPKGIVRQRMERKKA